MGRRDFLLGTLAAISAGVAGCNGLGGSGNVQETYELSATDNLAMAVGQLNKAALSVAEFQDRNDTDSSSDDTDGTGTPAEADSQRRTFDASKPRERVAAAREAISRATENGAEQADVQAVRQYADGVGGTVDAVANVTTASNRLAEVEDSFDSDDIDTDAASATLAKATTASTNAQNAHEDAQTALASANRDRLRAVDAEYDALKSGVESLLGYIVGVDGLAVGYETYVTGVDGLQTAQDQVDAEEFDAARGSFSDAQTTFTDSASEFTDAMEGADETLQSDLTKGDERSRALNRLSAGYVSLVDSRDHVKTAESDIDDEKNDAAREKLSAGSDDATTASDRFEDGATIRDGEFGEKFQTAQDKATAMQSLSDGYLSVLDAGDYLEDGESAFRDENYDRAGAAFSDAGAAADRAESTFSEGDAADDSGTFDTAFSRAFRRTSALQSLSEGYGLVVRGRQTAQAGRQELRDGNFETAKSQFQTAASTFAEAETVFADGQADAGETFGPELDRALCRVGHLRNATSHFIAATEAGSDGDRSTLQSEQSAAEADIDRVDGC